MTITEMREQNAPLAQIVESFFRASYDISPKTEQWYRQNLKAYLRFVETNQGREARLRDINKPLVDAFLKERRAIPTRKYPSGSPFAVRAAAVTLKRFANYLAEDGIAADARGASVLLKVKRGKIDDDVRRPLTDQEMERLINTATRLSPTARAICLFAFSTGLRLNELCEARVSDLSIERGEFSVRAETSKFGRSRSVFLHPAIVREIERYLRARSITRDADAPLFPTRTGEHFSVDGLSKLFQRLRAASGINTFSAHLMRHTWATNFMREPGASLLELKREGGWNRWAMVERYSHAVPHANRATLPNPLDSHKAAFVQPPSSRVSRLSQVG